MPCGKTLSQTEEPVYSIGESLWESSNGTNGSYGSYQSGQMNYKRKTTYGECTPNFHKRKNAGELIPFTKFSQFESEGKLTPGRCTVFTEYSAGNWMRNIYTADAYCGSWIVTRDQLEAYAPQESDMNYQVQRAAASIYSKGHDTLTFLAELGKTKQMFIRTFRNLTKIKSSRQYWKPLRDLYLEGRYGWRPLVYDLIDLHEAVNLLQDEKRHRFSETKGTTTHEVKSYEEGPFSQGGCQFYVNHTDVITTGVRGHVVADIDPPAMRLNPMVTGWELVPYSFVIDWGLKVGIWLEAMSLALFAKGYVASGGYKITIKRSSTFTRYVANPAYYSQTLTYGSLGAKCSGSLLYRVPMKVSLRPHVSVDLSVDKLMDVIELIRHKKSTFRPRYSR